MAGRQLHLVARHLPSQLVEDAPALPAFRDLVELQRHQHARERAHRPVDPRVVLLQLQDADGRSRLHAAFDAVVVQGVIVVRVLVRGIFRGGAQRGQERPGAHPLLRVLEVVGDPGVRAAAPAVRAHRRSGDAVERLALQVVVEDERARHGKRARPLGGGGPIAAAGERPHGAGLRPVAEAAAEERPQRIALRPVAEAVPQQAVQLAPRPVQVHGRVQHLGGVGEVGDLRRVGLVRPQEHLHPQPLARTQVQRRLQQAANRPVHVLPVVGATVQGVEQHNQVHALPVEFGVALLERAVDGVRVLRDVTRPRRPRGAFPERVVFAARELPGQHRPPDDPRFEPGHQPAQVVGARILVRRRRGAEPGPHLRVLVQGRPLDGPAHHPPHRAVLQRAPPEGLAGAPHAGHELHVGVQRLHVRRRQVDVSRRRRAAAVARAFRQGQQRLAQRRGADSCAVRHAKDQGHGHSRWSASRSAAGLIAALTGHLRQES